MQANKANRMANVAMRRASSKEANRAEVPAPSGGRHAISPEEQQFVNEVSREHGHPKGTPFDRYVEDVDCRKAGVHFLYIGSVHLVQPD